MNSTQGYHFRGELSASNDALRLAFDTVRQLGKSTDLEDFVACGLGYRKIGEHVRLAAVISLSNEDRVCSLRTTWPRALCGFPLVVEYGHALRPCVLRKSRPHGGAGIRPAGSSRLGSLGCFVTRYDQAFALTCEHVLGSPTAAGDEVEWFRPTRRKGGWVKLGAIAELGGLTYNGSNCPTDSALIAISDHRSRRCRLRRPSAGPLDEFDALAIKAAVHKLGAKTGYTRGRVSGILDIKVGLPGGDGDAWRPTVRHDGVLEIVSDDNWGLCEGGDSGAIFWERERHPRAVGLLFATTFGYKGYAIPMKRVLDHHGVVMSR